MCGVRQYALDAERAPFDGLVEISVVKDDVGALASQLERDVCGYGTGLASH